MMLQPRTLRDVDALEIEILERVNLRQAEHTEKNKKRAEIPAPKRVSHHAEHSQFRSVF